jgi:aryl-alcohol dehydrogenase-like predicted oxidoreductase
VGPAGGRAAAGKYRRNAQPPVGSRRLPDWNEPPGYDPEGLSGVVEMLIGIGAQHGVSAAQVALAWTLGRPGVTSAVIGARTTEQLADNLAAEALRLTAEERERLDQASAPPLLCPH